MRKGSVTIYMSLILCTVMSLFLTVIEGARCRAIGLRAESAFDLAVYSVFAEYNRALFEEYGLLFVDTSYGEIQASIKRTEQHLAFYLQENLDAQTLDGIETRLGTDSFVFDATKTFPEQIAITKCSYATDENGAVFERQAVEYMKHKYGIAYIEKIQKELEKANEHQLFQRDISAERDANQEQIDEAEREGIETGEVDEEGNPIRKEIELENPADQVNQIRSKGILHLVTEETDLISERTADLSACTSHKKPSTKGNGLKGRDAVSVAETLLFDAYVLEQCGTYTNPKETGQLKYQAEYILAGKDNDIDNLKAVVHRLLLLREISNVVYLFSDPAKVSEAAALATSICSAAGAMVLVEPVKISLLFAWAYAEALYDVRELLAGNRVLLMKTAQSWHFSLQGMLQAEAEHVSGEGSSVTQGLNYQEYLRLFLALENRSQKVLRMMDIVEMDVRQTSGFEWFDLSDCVDYLEVEACVGSRYGYSREMKRTYGYI